MNYLKKIYLLSESITEYFLSEYTNHDFIIKEKTRNFLGLCFAVFFIAISMNVFSLLRGITDIGVIGPPFLAAFLFIISLAILKKGKYKFAVHFILISSFSAVWATMFFEKLTTDVAKIDTIVLIIALLCYTPMAIINSKKIILIYYSSNLLIFFLFILHLKYTLLFSNFNLIEFSIDVILSSVFIGITIYQFFKLNENALNKAIESEVKIQRQYEELQAANEEYEAINEELFSSQKEIIESEEKYRSILENIEDGYCELNNNNEIIFFNNSFVSILGYPYKHILNSSIYDYIDPEMYENVRTSLGELIKGERKSIIANIEICHRSGKKKQIEFSISTKKDQFNEHTEIQCLARDKTEKIKFEREILKNQKIESLGIFAGGIAHDFNNLLAGIIGNISLALADTTKENSNYEILKEAEKASSRAKDLTLQLLTFSKGGEPIKTISSIKDILTETANFVLSGSNISMTISIPENINNVEIDKGQISQVIQNIILNSRQVMPYGGSIHLNVSNCVFKPGNKVSLKAGKYIEIEIKDSGPGIPEDIIENIFDPFFTTKKIGSGLGLSVTHSILQKHGGCITATSFPDLGASFKVYLPASEKKLQIYNTADTFHQKYSGKVLLMDDEDMVLNIGSKMLKKIGFTVDIAKNGEEAIELYKKAFDNNDSYVIVIMDLTIPGGIGGKEAVETLKKINPNIKAIVSSGYSNDPIMANYSEYAFSGVVTKPYNIQELEKAISDVLNKGD